MAEEFPSYESLLSASHAPPFSMETLRLRWKPFGPLSTSIMVVDDVFDPESPTRPYQTGTDPATGEPTFHPVAAASLTTPPVSSIAVEQWDLEGWVREWEGEHLQNAYSEEDAAEWGPPSPSDPDYDDLIDPDGNGAMDGQILLRFHGEERPRPPRPPHLVVRPAAAAAAKDGGEGEGDEGGRGRYVTVTDFVAAAHAWLQTQRDNILAARGVALHGNLEPLPPDTPMYVCTTRLKELVLDDDLGTRPPNWDNLWRRVAWYARKQLGATPTTSRTWGPPRTSGGLAVTMSGEIQRI